jgi:hypothetical protein
MMSWLTARDPFVDDMRKQWARLKDELIGQGWIDRQDVQRDTARRGPGQRPKTRAEKREAKAAWNGIPPDSRPPLEEWLEAQFGTEPDGSLSVPPSTFHSWEKLVQDS